MGFHKNRNHRRQSRQRRRDHLNLVSSLGERFVFECLGCDTSYRVVELGYRKDKCVSRHPIRFLGLASRA